MQFLYPSPRMRIILAVCNVEYARYLGNCVGYYVIEVGSFSWYDFHIQGGWQYEAYFSNYVK